MTVPSYEEYCEDIAERCRAAGHLEITANDVADLERRAGKAIAQMTVEDTERVKSIVDIEVDLKYPPHTN